MADYNYGGSSGNGDDGYFLYKDGDHSTGTLVDAYGVINEDEEVLEKIKVAKKYNKLIDGHAPQLRGLDLNKYIEKGIMSDHECTTEEEALEKIRLGIKLMVREGTASKNINLLKIREKIDDTKNIMLVSDDISIKDLKNGYMLNTLKKAIKYVSPIEAIQMITINPANYFGFDVGIKPSNNADLIIFEDLQSFKIDKVIIKGKFLEEYNLFKNNDYNNNHKQDDKFEYNKYNIMNYTYKSKEDFLINNIDVNVDNKINNKDNNNNSNNKKSVRIITPIKDSLITKEEIMNIDEAKEKLNKNEINRIYIIERHKGTNNIGKGLIKFLKKGTIASTYAHDSHNVVVVGNNLDDIAIAVNHLKDIGGGFVAVDNGEILESVQLNIAGIMGYCGELIYEKMESIERITKHWGIFDDKDYNLFLAMSFLSLSVIPELKITDKGLVKNNEIVDLVF
jgi:adenine deaminase